jgi:hypothetical protein
MFYETTETFGEELVPEDPGSKNPIILDIYDSDGSPNTEVGDDYMCRTVIPVIEGKTMFKFDPADEVKPIERKDGLNIMLIEDKKKHKRIDRNSKNIPAPAWMDCYFKRGDPVCGQILCSFIIVKQMDYPWEHNNPKDFSIVESCVPFQEMLVSINVLGLRNL